MTKVSIVVPVYNVEKYLDRCVQSLLNQTLKDIEIILVDDKSPDNSPAMCDEYALKDSRIRVVHKSKNEGLGMACNSGLEVASGEYVAFCDSDDWVDNNMYQVLYDTATRENAQIVYSGLKRVDGEGNILGYLPHRDRIETYRNEDVLDLLLDMIASKPECKFDRTIQVSAKVALYNRLFLKERNIKFVSERIYPSEDLIFNVLALLYAVNVVILPSFFYNYFVNYVSISTTVKPFHFKNIINSSKLIISHFQCQKKYNLTEMEDKLHVRLARFLIGEARSQCSRIIHSSLSYKDKRRLLRDLHYDILTQEIIKEYPVNHLPKKYALMHYLIAWKCYAFMTIILPILI